MTSLVVMVAAAVLVVVFAPDWVRPASPPKIVYVNSAVIVNAAMRKVVADPSITDEKIAAEAKRLTDGIMAKVDAWTASGLIVVNGAAVLGAPPEIDLTGDVARAVGVDLGAKAK